MDSVGEEAERRNKPPKGWGRGEIVYKSITCAFIFKGEVWERVWFNEMRRYVVQPLYKTQAHSVAGDRVGKRTAAADYSQLKNQKVNKAKLPLRIEHRNKTENTGHGELC